MIIINRIFRWIGRILIFFFVSSILSVVILKYMPVYFTPLMFIRAGEQIADGNSPKIDHKWIPLDSMSNNLPMAVIAAEDNNFMTHNGFDYEEILKALGERQQGGKERGASTISQQTAKNVFLWPGHSWIRKGFEAYFTVLIEKIWGKKRIMEVYLNSIEMGKGVYGVKAATKYYFESDPQSISRDQAINLAIILPNPLEYDPKNLTSFLSRRKKTVTNNFKFIKGTKLEAPWGYGKTERTKNNHNDN